MSDQTRASGSEIPCNYICILALLHCSQVRLHKHGSSGRRDCFEEGVIHPCICIMYYHAGMRRNMVELSLLKLSMDLKRCAMVCREEKLRWFESRFLLEGSGVFSVRLAFL